MSDVRGNIFCSRTALSSLIYLIRTLRLTLKMCKLRDWRDILNCRSLRRNWRKIRGSERQKCLD